MSIVINIAGVLDIHIKIDHYDGWNCRFFAQQTFSHILLQVHFTSKIAVKGYKTYKRAVSHLSSTGVSKAILYIKVIFLCFSFSI